MSLWRSRYPQANALHKICIIAAEFNEPYVEALLETTCRGLRRCGINDNDIDILRVPGSFEIPFLARQVAENRDYDGIVTLGVIIRGETIHFELVAENAARGIADVALQTNIPIIFGVLACENVEQVEARIELGEEYARSIVKMINLMSEQSGDSID